MNPIPMQAKAVAKILRKDVKKPARADFILLPCLDGFSLRTPERCACPMGLHPSAQTYRPWNYEDFPLTAEGNIHEFADWWDSLKKKDLGRALDAIWGFKREGT